MQSPRTTPQLPGLNELANAHRVRPDGSLDPAGEAGWFLMRERMDRGLTIEQAGDETGIHPFHIDAIEHGDMRRMPARTTTCRLAPSQVSKLRLLMPLTTSPLRTFISTPS